MIHGAPVCLGGDGLPHDPESHHDRRAIGVLIGAAVERLGQAVRDGWRDTRRLVRPTWSARGGSASHDLARIVVADETAAMALNSAHC